MKAVADIFYIDFWANYNSKLYVKPVTWNTKLFHIIIPMWSYNTIKFGENVEIFQSIAGRCRNHTCNDGEKCLFDGEKQKCVTACKL